MNNIFIHPDFTKLTEEGHTTSKFGIKLKENLYMKPDGNTYTIENNKNDNDTLQSNRK